MDWSEYDEIVIGPQHDAEAELQRERQFEELDDRQRRSE